MDFHQTWCKHWYCGIWFLLMGKVCQFLTQLPACNTSVFSFPDDNLSKYQWIFTKLGMCIDICRSSLGLLMSKFCKFLTCLPMIGLYFHFQMINVLNINRFSPNLVCASIFVEIWPWGYKTFFMLNSAEHEIFSANKYENASWHFHIY